MEAAEQGIEIVAYDKWRGLSLLGRWSKHVGIAGETKSGSGLLGRFDYSTWGTALVKVMDHNRTELTLQPSLGL